MAKRKRLTPAVITDAPALETKSAIPRYPLGVAPKTRAPIADVAQDASASAALTEIAQTLSDARAEGRLLQRIPLAAIRDDYLVRDRIINDDAEMETLTESLRERGQQTAIEVTDLGDGQFGLISGWRRVQALRQISTETPTLDWALAVIRTPEDSAAAYLAMVEENEIRVGLSYYERARIVARAVDQGIYGRDRVALAALFHAASRAKRSKIGSFVAIVRALDDHLRFPTALTERTGLALAQALEADAALADQIIAALGQTPVQTASQEAELIAQAMTPKAQTPPAPKPDTSRTQPGPTPPPVAADAHNLREGLRYKQTAKGEIVLSGPLLNDAHFMQDLLIFLAQKPA